MDIVLTKVAGTLESNDVLVTVGPCHEGVDIQINSIVKNQFEQSIRDAVLSVVDRLGIRACSITLEDKGALDCTIKARVETALRRAMEA